MPALPRPQAALAIASFLAGSMVALAGCSDGPQEGVLRLGYFPNLTHAQALYGVETGLFQEHLGSTRLETEIFNAGPPAFESLLAGRTDVIYVGPGPTISAIEVTGDNVIRIISGRASGGVAFVVRPGLTLVDGDDYKGHRFASPQLGNTQDVALKNFLEERGLDVNGRDRDVTVINAANPDILTLFEEGDIDGAWVPEPWASRLVLDGGGVVHVNERDLWPDGQFVTTHLVTTKKFLDARSDDVANLLQGHFEATTRLQQPDGNATQVINDAIERATGKRLSERVLQSGFANVTFTVDPLSDTFAAQYGHAHGLGLSRSRPVEIGQFYDLALHEQILRDTRRAQS